MLPYLKTPRDYPKEMIGCFWNNLKSRILETLR